MKTSNVYLIRQDATHYIISNNGNARKVASKDFRKVARKACKVATKAHKPLVYSHNGETVSAIF